MIGNLTDALRRWCDESTERLSKEGVSLEYAKNTNKDAPSALVDLVSDLAFARATVWNAGFCDREALLVETGEQLFWRHDDNVTAARLFSMLDELVVDMKRCVGK